MNWTGSKAETTLYFPLDDFVTHIKPTMLRRFVAIVCLMLLEADKYASVSGDSGSRKDDVINPPLPAEMAVTPVVVAPAVVAE